jgi:hypothetical protein
MEVENDSRDYTQAVMAAIHGRFARLNAAARSG